MFCTQCGSGVEAGDAFCGSCGASVRKEAGTPVSGQPIVIGVDPRLAVVGSMPIRRTSVLAMIGLMMVTLGFYEPYWWLSRRREINAASAGEAIGQLPFVFSIGLLALYWFFYIVSGLAIVGLQGARPDTETLVGIAMFQIIAVVSALAAGILLIVQAFKLQRMLERHPQSRGIRMSGVATFLFRVLYLQYKINQMKTPATMV